MRTHLDIVRIYEQMYKNLSPSISPERANTQLSITYKSTQATLKRVTSTASGRSVRLR